MTDKPIRNPFRPSGEFTPADRVAAFDKVFENRKSFLDTMHRKGRMRSENYDSEIGALLAIQADLKAQMVADQEVRDAIRKSMPSGDDTHPGLAIIRDHAES
jgi:hypothetical protein